MSAKFLIWTTDKASGFNVEITSDLELIFLDYDITYDEAAFEFGYEKTDALRFVETWQADPMWTAYKYLRVPRIIRMLAACDWVEHVLPIYERRSTKRVRNKPRAVVEKARKTLMEAMDSGVIPKGGLGYWAIGKNSVSIERLRNMAMQNRKLVEGTMGIAAERVAQASVYLASGHDSSEDVSITAASAFGWYDPDPNVFPTADLRGEKMSEELIWQVRRLIDVVGAIQDGKPRLPIEATP